MKDEMVRTIYEWLRKELGEEKVKGAVEKARKELEGKVGWSVSWEDAVLHLASKVREEKARAGKEVSETLVTNFPPETVYLSLLDHFTSRKDVKVKRYTEPSHLEIEIDKWWQRAKIDLQPQEGGTNIGLNFELSDASITLHLLSMGYVLFSIISSMVTRHSAGVGIGFILLITLSVAEIYWYNRCKEKRKKFVEEMIRSIG